jgi:hypothetical protein
MRLMRLMHMRLSGMVFGSGLALSILAAVAFARWSEPMPRELGTNGMEQARLVRPDAPQKLEPPFDNPNGQPDEE